jgi:hypothetical protein
MACLKRRIKHLLVFRFVWAFGIIWICILNMPDSSAAEDIIIYGANAYGFDEIIEINLTANTSQTVGDPLFNTQAISQGPDGYVYYFEWASSGNELAYWDPTTGTNTLVRTYASTPWGLAKRAAFYLGQLYLMDDDGELYIVDTATGDWELLGTVEGIPTGSSSSGDMAFSPDGLLYVVISENLYTIELESESLVATLLDTNMIPGGGWWTVTVWTGLAFCDGSLYASDVNLFNRNSSIYRIDLSDDYPVTELINTGTMINDLTSCPVKEPCFGDYEPDGDVDGIDLLHLIAGELGDLDAAVDDFADCFGRSDCPTAAP